jgi:DNA (cytosine-5)-methyltransferase 1
MRFIDLFAGAGGLSEGFIRAGFKPVAHVEMDASACDTLRTRTAFHVLEKKHRSDRYHDYLEKKITRDDLWKEIPKELWNSVIHSEISDETLPGIFDRIDALNAGQKVDVIIGGPPCQAYSLVGRSRDPNRMADDKRNHLYKYYAKFLKRYKPKFFVFENVLGLLSAGNKKYFTEMRELFKKCGYETDFDVLNSDEYGVMQKRRRVIIIGRKGPEPFTFPKVERSPAHGKQILTDLFADLPKLTQGGGEDVMSYSALPSDYVTEKHLRNGVGFVTQHITRPHNQNDLKIYRKAIEDWNTYGTRLKYDTLPAELQTHQNKKAFLDRYKVVDGKGLSHTVVAHLAKDGHYFIHPDIKQLRSLSVREAARIQSFPDDYYFEGGRSSAFKQIGNAVPPLMAEKIAKSLRHKVI